MGDNLIELVLNHKMEIDSINDFGATVLGKRKSDLVGMNWRDNFLPKKVREEVSETVFREIVDSKGIKFITYKNPIIGANGKEIKVGWCNQYFLDPKTNQEFTLSFGFILE